MKQPGFQWKVRPVFFFVAQLVTFPDFSSPSGSQALRGACPLFEDITPPGTNIFAPENWIVGR